MAHFCPQCGAPVESEDKHCHSCGAKLGEQEHVTPRPAPQVGKSIQAWRWVGIALIVVLVVGGVFSGVKINNLTIKVNELESEYAGLQSDYDSLHSSYNSLRSDYDTLQGRMSELQSNYDELEAENEYLRGLLEQYEKVPHNYYSIGTFSRHANTYEELSSFLIWDFELPRGYERDVFDCSESAAYLEWALENAGFDAYIATGPTPWGPSSGYHAWVIVYTTDYNVAIEATALTGGYKFLDLFLLRTPGVVYKDDSLIPGWENYYDGYDHLYKNIYLFIRAHGNIEECNWWEGYWGFT